MIKEILGAIKNTMMFFLPCKHKWVYINTNKRICKSCMREQFKQQLPAQWPAIPKVKWTS